MLQEWSWYGALPSKSSTASNTAALLPDRDAVFVLTNCPRLSLLISWSVMRRSDTGAMEESQA